MDTLNKKQKIIIIVIAILMVLFIAYYIINKLSSNHYIDLDANENDIIVDNLVNEFVNKQEEDDDKIIVHITGAIEKEGVVEIEEGSRIADVIENAGGVSKEADLSKINLAYEVSDGQKIYVPSITDEETIDTIQEDAGENIIEDSRINTISEKVNINTANQTELETLNGIGPSTALKIINYRKQNGYFQNIEDIKNVPGIGEAKFESIKQDICI